ELKKIERMSPAARAKAREFLVHSDLIKFAKYSPAPDEIVHNREQVVTIIDETKVEPEEGAPASGADTAG
ncbi:hypothetical protein ACFL43_06450, partial [Thermodesulfobacteriota bacterium]